MLGDIRVKDGVSGDWKIETFVITETSALQYNIRERARGRSDRDIIPGIYKRLTRSGEIVMSNTPAELRDHRVFVDQARMVSTVLIAGLGLGVALNAVLESKTVEKVVVVEKSPDVIDLVAPAYMDESRVSIIQEDIFKWGNPWRIQFDVVWFDIWDAISPDNVYQMNELFQMYDTALVRWMSSWCYRECIMERNR